jgi:hypothetical protein
MSDSRKQTLGILMRISEFLETLPEDHLADLESGAARLTFIPAGASEPMRPTARPRAASARAAKPVTVDVSAIAEAVRTAETREAAATVLKPLRKDPELKDVAVQLNVVGLGNLSRDKLIEAIVEATVGNRLDTFAIRGNANLPY